MLTPRLAKLELGALWRTLLREPPSFWLASTYLFFEYVRPQQIYPAIAVFPWARASILLGVAALVLEGKRLRWSGPADWLMAAFTAIILASSVAAYQPSVSYQWLTVWWSWLLVYFLIANAVVTQRRVLLFTLLFIVCNLKMSQFAVRSWYEIGFQFRDWGVSGAPGWFGNSGEFGIEMTVFLPVALYLALGLRPTMSRPKYLLLLAAAGTALIGIVASSSRGAVMGAAGLGVWLIGRSRYRARALLGTAVVAVAVILLIPPESKARFAEMGHDPDSMSRLTYWRDGLTIMWNHPLLGIGYSNWLPYYTAHYQFGNSQVIGDATDIFRAWQVCHNPFIQAGAELGVPGLLAFIALIVATFVTNARTRRLAQPLDGAGRFLRHMAWGFDGALVGFLVSGFFVTVLYYPYFWVNLAMTVGLHRAARHTARTLTPAAIVPDGRPSSHARDGLDRHRRG